MKIHFKAETNPCKSWPYIVASDVTKHGVVADDGDVVGGLLASLGRGQSVEGGHQRDMPDSRQDGRKI